MADRDVLRRVAAEPALMLSAGRALLLQIAHPKVAQGVADHSDFENRPLPRLLGTLDFLILVAFGTAEEAERAGAGIRKLHERITGPGYSGNDPDLQAWVNATLIDAALEMHVRLGGSEAVAEEYLRQAKVVAEVLGCPPEAQAADLEEFRAYMAEMSGSLEVSDVAREIARAILWSRRFRRLGLGPALWTFRFLTTGMLPERMRAEFGLPWSDRHQAWFDRTLPVVLRFYRLVPRPVRGLVPRAHLAILRRRRRSSRGRATPAARSIDA